MDHFDGQTFSRIWSLKERRWALLSLESLGTVDRPHLVLRIEVRSRLSEDQIALIVSQVEHTYSLNLDLNAFYTTIKKEEPVWELTRAYLGMKPALEPNLFEALVWAITGQQLSMVFACQVKEGMLAQFGGTVEIGGKRYYRHPDPEEVAATDPAEWRAFKSSTRKAEYTIGLAKLVRDGFDLEALQSLPDEEIIAKLTQIRGIGAWTAEYVLVRGLGRWDALPAADAGLINGVRKAYKLDHRPTTKEILALAERWRPWRGLATYYLWWAR